jgi:hypothetical protein
MRVAAKISVLLSLFLLTLAPRANAQISFGIQIGQPPAPRAYVVPVQPGPGYEWVEGYWYPVNGHYRWHNGYWTHAPYAGAYWVAPWWDGGQYHAGYWGGARGEIAHDHRWDRDRRRDEAYEHREEHRDRH